MSCIQIYYSTFEATLIQVMNIAHIMRPLQLKKNYLFSSNMYGD